jgi:hypothetical protein
MDDSQSFGGTAAKPVSNGFLGGETHLLLKSRGSMEKLRRH